MKNRLTIAIQKKGRLFDQSADLIKKSGINFSIKTDNLLAKAFAKRLSVLTVSYTHLTLPTTERV